MRRLFAGLVLLCALLCLNGCSVLLDEGAQVQPDLRLLSRPVYEEEAVAQTVETQSAEPLRLDLWLDASHTMGGINLNEKSMYPHHGVRYREGGFHYRYDDTTSLYDSLLHSMLASVEGSRVRLLRYGNERLPDAFLLSEGLTDQTATPEQYRSMRRDMLTYAIDPMPSVLLSLSSEKMAGSFYALGSPLLHQTEDLRTFLLENPDSAQSMTEALSEQIDAIADERDDRLTALENDSDYPLLYALDNLDLTRLSVITCDPASIRRLTAVADDGTPVELIRQRMDERGVFDAGLSVGLYAFTLDYVGQLSSFGTADFSEPLIWGELKYNNQKGRIETVLPMPRVLLTFVIGKPAQVEAFAAGLNRRLETESVYQQLRGPEKNELVYARNGETVKQQPFGFSFEYLQITRPELASYHQHSPGVTLATTSGTVDAATRLVSLYAGQTAQITVTVPAENADAALTDLKLMLQNSLVLSRTMDNSPDASIPETAQVIALRDKLYLYEHQPSAAAFALSGVQAQDGALVFTIDVPKELEAGYHRLSLSADFAAGAVAWETPAWVEEMNASLTSEQVSEWENFSSLMTTYERKRENIAYTFQHAWGEASQKLYYGVPYPDFPPVYKAPGLSGLVSQLQSAADMRQSPCLRYSFDIFVNNR